MSIMVANIRVLPSFSIQSLDRADLPTSGLLPALALVILLGLVTSAIALLLALRKAMQINKTCVVIFKHMERECVASNDKHI
jgi:hypothetical protein